MQQSRPQQRPQQQQRPQRAVMDAEAWEAALRTVEDEYKQLANIDGILSFEKEVKFAATICANSYDNAIGKTPLATVHSAFLSSASIGLTLNPSMKLAYLVPRDGQCKLDISYMGLQKLATDTGSVLTAKAELVYENDTFDYKGPFEPPLHKLNPFKKKDRGELIGVYVWAKLPNGIDQIDTLDMEEIKKIKAKSKAKSGPWQDWFEEMVKKAAIKRAYKGWPKTERLSAAEALLNEMEGNEEPIRGNRVSGSAASDAAREEERLDVDDDELAPVKKTLEAEAKKGKAAYEAAWKAITKEQRKALVTEHTGWKAIALSIDNGGDNA